jgi:phosphoribosylanthranilate isomerase
VRLWIKVCGVASEAALEAAVAAGADALGFVFYAGSPRNLAPARAAELAARVPRSVSRVAVTRHPTQPLIDAIVAGFRPDLLQTDLGDLESLRLPAWLAALPVLRSDAGPSRPLPPRFLFEGAESGRGSPADWSQAAALARRAELVLAGGLNPGNVGAAIEAVRPFGVDVSSGVESSPGVKDAALIHEFVTAARAAVTQ